MSREAGILLHVTSLPGKFGCGDFGSEALKFIRFLARAKQRCWQVLPLGPTVADRAFSPYSPLSGMALNPVLISLEPLVKGGYLTRREIRAYEQPSRAVASLTHAVLSKNILLGLAWKKFSTGSFRKKLRYREFCRREREWLDDFSLFVTIREQQKNKPWYEWPVGLKKRRHTDLSQFRQKFADEINAQKWFQFVAFEQWKIIRRLCASLHISLIGDLPFYVGHDSADVWSHPEIFCLKTSGAMSGVAGVPPDYFNANGQLWGMPVFNWNRLKKSNYNWWLLRMKKNQQLYDIIRLDHFRAFSDYWKVPAGEKNAKRGFWRKGPGKHFFDTIRNQGVAPSWIAEDLGDIDDRVRVLITSVGLPGMKVLQFAFGNKNMDSEYLPGQFVTPHCVVFTGTHDNNTTRGWFQNEIDKQTKNRIERYLGKTVAVRTISKVLIRAAYSSIATTAIIPLQDFLNLDERARMNTPATLNRNWKWRMLPGKLTPKLEKEMAAMVFNYNRGAN